MIGLETAKEDIIAKVLHAPTDECSYIFDEMPIGFLTKMESILIKSITLQNVIDTMYLLQTFL